MDIGKIIFVNVAENPDVGQVRDGERIGRAQTRYATCGCNLLVGDDSGSWCANFNDRRWMIDVSSEDAKALRSVLHIDLGLVFRILSHLQFVQRDCALAVKQL